MSNDKPKDNKYATDAAYRERRLEISRKYREKLRATTAPQRAERAEQTKHTSTTAPQRAELTKHTSTTAPQCAERAELTKHTSTTAPQRAMEQYTVSLIDPSAQVDFTRSRKVVDEAPFTPEVILRPWSHALYNEARWLSNANFVSTSLLVYDFDEGEPTLAATSDLVYSLNLAHVLGPSSSHQKQKGSKPAVDRFRLVLFLERAITDVHEYLATYTGVAEQLGFQKYDKQTKDVARFWKGCTEVTSALMPDEGGELVEPVQPILEKRPAREVLKEVLASSVRGKPNQRTLEFIGGFAADKPWHSERTAAALDLKAQGFSEEEACEMLAKASPVGELDATDLAQIADIYAKREPLHKQRIAWPKMLETKRGPEVDKNSTDNFVYLVTKLLDGAPLTYFKNEINNKYYVNSKEGRELDDGHMTKAYAAAAEAGLAKDTKLIENALKVAATSYNPVKDAIMQRSWDGVDRIPELFKTLRLSEDVTPEAANFYQEVYLRRWIYAAVKRIYSPGSENGVLVFSGPQGGGKSRWFKKLATSIWYRGFTDALIDPDNKDHLAYLVDSFIHHIAELDATTSTKHAGKLKDYLNKSTATFRRPYERVSVTQDTICSFCATVNPSTFLQDPTGSRRFFVIPVEEVDANHNVDIQQLLAQAHEEAVVNDYRTWLNKEEIEKVNEFNFNFQFEEDFEGEIKSRVIPGEDSLTVREICEQLDIDYQFLNKTQKERVNSILQMKKIKRVNHAGRVVYKVDAKNLRLKSIHNVVETNIKGTLTNKIMN